MYKDIKVDYGIQVVFSTIPNQKQSTFEKDVETNYFKDYKKEIGSKDNFLYKPLKFFMLGDYDVCYISLINNFKFAHRLFEPKNSPGKTYNPHTFQSFAGFALNDTKTLRKLFRNQPCEYFIGIVNLKLNNGLLIGNGLEFIESVFEYLKKELKDIPFILTQTFSWFELSLVIFVNDPIILTTIITNLRLAEFEDLDDHKKLKNSLYHSYFSGNEKRKILSTSLFADTHTYFGFNEYLITKPLKDEYVKEFKRYVRKNKIELKTDIEWQVKPGHILELENTIKKRKTLEKYFQFDKRKLVLGKCDYMLQEVDNSILSNFELVRYIHNFNKCKLFNHARKVRSYVFLDATGITETNKKKSNKNFPLSWDDKLAMLAVPSADFYACDEHLKKLKVSRQIRIKILKIFSNYNNGIQDPILFPYFLDFRIFILNLIKLINHEVANAESGFTKLKDLEKILNENIIVFQEGYNVRFLNGYQFENISDFDLDFNSSIQQLLTSYSTLVFEYGKLFYDKSTYAPIIQLNNIDTVSNNLSINYSIHHLTSPEFVFTTLLKEILNQLQSHNDAFRKLSNAFHNSVENIKDNINESYLDDMFETKLVDLNYFMIDAIRFVVTFNGDLILFKHWFWTYNFQNSSLYDSGGMFNEDYMRMEMLRIMLVKEFYGIKIKGVMKCPTPELYTYWKRHYRKIKFIAKQLVIVLKEQQIDQFIKFVLNKYLDTYSKQPTTYNDTINTFMGYLDKSNVVDSDNYRKKLSFLFSPTKPKHGVKNIECLIFQTLVDQFELNKKTIQLLKRDWKTGKALNNHKELYKNCLYAIDQTGGVYFHNTVKMNEYFRYNANCLLSIIDFSYKQKKQFILDNANV